MSGPAPSPFTDALKKVMAEPSKPVARKVATREEAISHLDEVMRYLSRSSEDSMPKLLGSLLERKGMGKLRSGERGEVIEKPKRKGRPSMSELEKMPMQEQVQWFRTKPGQRAKIDGKLYIADNQGRLWPFKGYSTTCPECLQPKGEGGTCTHAPYLDQQAVRAGALIAPGTVNCQHQVACITNGGCQAAEPCPGCEPTGGGDDSGENTGGITL